MEDKPASDRVVSFVPSTIPQTFSQAVTDQQLANDLVRGNVDWRNEIQQSAFAKSFPVLARAFNDKGLPPSLFRILCETLLDNRWIADAIATDIQNLPEDTQNGC